MGALSQVKNPTASMGAAVNYEYAVDAEGNKLSGREAWRSYYRTGQSGWKDQKLGRKLAAFIDGSANFLTSIGVPLKLGVGIMAVLVASFAATTLDTATRLQRYVLQELGSSLHLPTLRDMLPNLWRVSLGHKT